MNRYKIVLTSAAGFFLTIAVFSLVVGASWWQGLFILIGLIPLILTFIVGTAALGGEKFWWQYFKPLAAVPLAWFLLHVLFMIVFPNVAETIWIDSWHLLVGVNLAAFVLNAIVSKKIDFEKRFTRWAIAKVYVMLFLLIAASMFGRIMAGQEMAKLERSVFSRQAYSRLAMMMFKVEEKAAKQEIDPYFKIIRQVINQDDEITEEDLENVEQARKAIKKELKTIPEEKLFNWQETYDGLKKEWHEWFSERAEAKTTRKKQARVLYGTYSLPPGGVVVAKDILGRKMELYNKELAETIQPKGQYGCFKWVNENTKSHTVCKRYQALRGTDHEIVKLMNLGEMPITVDVSIKPRRY